MSHIPQNDGIVSAAGGQNLAVGAEQNSPDLVCMAGERPAKWLPGRHVPQPDRLVVTGRSQYLSIRYSERLSEAGIEPSVGSVGNSYDNALAESVIGLFKTEVIHRQGPWRSLEAVEYATLEWVDWFNNRRLLEPIGNVPPAEFESAYYAQEETPVRVAGLT